MRKKLNSWLVMVALVAMAVAVWRRLSYAASEDPVGHGGCLRYRDGRRALGMGGAFVAVADDGKRHLLQPAGLAGVEGHKVSHPCTRPSMVPATTSARAMPRRTWGGHNRPDVDGDGEGRVRQPGNDDSATARAP
jgi:hypothetical protein